MSNNHLEFPQGTLFLVTGGSGFIGSHICEAIQTLGYRVRCLDDLSTGSLANIDSFNNNPNFEFIKGDIKDLKTCMNACKNVDYVLHQAAWGNVPRSIIMPLFYCENNILGTLNMLEASRQCGVKRFVYASSSSVFGDSKQFPQVEGQEATLLSPYALTKRCDEEWAKQYSLHYSLSTIGLRYFNVFGPRQCITGSFTAAIPSFIRSLLKDERPIINGDGSQSRDFTYVKNVVYANLKACLAQDNASSRVFNIAQGERQVLLDVYSRLNVLLEKNISPIFMDKRAGDMSHTNANISLAQQMLNYNPIIDFDEGLKTTVEWYKANLQRIA